MTSRLISAFLLLSAFYAQSSHAQVTRAFEDRVSFNVNGNITMVGNTLLTCDSSDWWCSYYQSNTLSGSNGTEMVFVNTDAAAGYSNSSSATLTIPNGATVLHAELYWSGRHNNNEVNRDKIRIKAPGSGSYSQVTAHTIDTFSSEGSSGSRPYQASADVTQIVANGGTGNYIVGDLKAKTGNDSLGFYGGWALAVVYQDNTEPFRRLMLFDGAATVVGSNTVSITTDNLITPFSGSFDTYLGALVWEGDQSLDGDSLVFEGNTLDESLNPDDNFWNSSITSFNSRVTNKSPDYVNQLGMDLVMTDVSGLLPNGETQADIDFVTDGDYYFPHALAFVTDLYLPDFDSSMDKTATDINGGQVEPGDVIEYRISFENTGQDTAINTEVTDVLPTGITYIPNSLEIVSSSSGPAGAMTDSSGDDAAQYDGNNQTITFWVGSNAAAGQGGDFLPGEAAVVKFLATVDNQSSGAVSNSATIDFNAQSTPAEALIAEDDAVINVVATAGIIVTKSAQLTVDNGNPGTADAGDEITFNIGVENTGNLAMTNINLSDAMAPLGTVTCPSNNLAAFSSMNCDSYSYIVTQGDTSNGGSIDNTVQLTAVDAAAGNHQDSDSTQTVLTLAEPVITTPSDGDLLNNSTPTVSGTGPVGAQIDVLTDQGSSCQAIVDGTGNWSCDISPALTDGSVIISAFASDGGSNQSTTDSVTVDLDATAPSAPGVDAPTNGQPITGTGEPGATVTVITESGGGCTAVVQANGSWSCTLTGPYADEDDITVTQEDDAGNVSPPTVVANGIDTQAPVVSITTPVDGSLINDNTPTVSGSSEADAIIMVTIGGVEVCSTVADGSGNWSCDVSPAVNDGPVQIDVTASDIAGNTSNPESVSIIVDATAPGAPGVDAPTNGQPITGTGEPGATITVITESGGGCTAVVQGDGTWSCTITGPAANGDDITVTQEDDAGNVSPPTVVPNGLDTQAPALTITAPSNGSLTNDNTPTVSGTSEADALISVTIGGVEVCSTIADSNGDWSCDVSPAVTDGSVQIDVTASDIAGNTSNQESVSIVVDATAPGAPGVDTPTNGQPVSGTGEPGATVNVGTTSGASCTAIVQANGTWSCTLTGNLVNGDDITATQTDEAGNTSGPTIVSGGLDTQAPAVSITSPANGVLTNDNTPTVSGTSEAGAAISVTIGGVEVCSTVADGSGNWSCDVSPAVSDGSVQIDVTASDYAGNTSNPESVTINVDTMAPGIPVINAPTNGQPVSGSGEPGATVDVTTPGGASCTATVQANGTWSCTLTGNLVNGDDITATQTDEAGNESDPTTVTGGLDTEAPGITITTPVDGDLTNNNTPTVSGTSEADAEISVTIGGVEVCSTIADSNGDWSCDVSPAVADGAVQIDVTASDAAGNTSNPQSVNITVDTTAPDAPVINTPTNGQPVSGTGEPGATVDVTTPGGASCTATVQANGTWSCTLTGNLVNGDDITATQTDEAGNESDPTTATGGLDTEAPSVSITAPADGALTNDNTPTVSGTSEVGAEISVTIGGIEVCTAVADSNGDWSCDVSPAVADGSVQIDVTASDAANNTSNPESVSITVDTTAPDAPVINAPTNGQPVTGIGEPGATVDVTTPGGASCSATVQGDGSWSCTLTGNLVNGDDITATQTDEAGNESDPTTETGGLDTEAPAVTITAPADGDLTNDNTPTVSGTSEAGAEISVTIGGVEVCTAVADNNGDWSCDVSPAVADGAVQIDVTASDAAGNTSNPESVGIDVDTTAPDAPVINAPTNGQPVTGTGEPDATVDVTTPGGASCSATVQGDGSWSCTLTGNLVNGDDITATQTDEAGNESDPTTVVGGLDTEAPDAPTITAPQNGTTINNASPTISGTAEANSTVTVSNQSGTVCEAQTNASGQWSCVPSSPLADGLQQLQAVAEDAAGNESQPGTSSFTVNSGASHTLIIDDATDLTTTEAGGTDSFTIVLPLTPTADVTVNLSSSDTTEGTVSPTTVTFTTANWNQPVTVTVTGVDDQVYDQDQSYTIDFSPLSSTDNNYNGVPVNSVDVINEDDDAQPDLSVFLTNCIDGSLPQQPISYYLTVTNEGNTDIQGARLTTVLPGNITNAEWDCVDQSGLACNRATGLGDLDEIIDLNSQETMLFTFVADVDGNLHDFLDASSQIEMPSGETDVNLLNNQAEDHDLLYQFIFKHGFECAAPGTVEGTTQQLERLFNLR
jgi:uncharacterized repeat protein (TIGR01451 family)